MLVALCCWLNWSGGDVRVHYALQDVAVGVAGLDYNKDGLITKAEAAAKVRAKLEKGLLAGNVAWVPARGRA